MVTITKTRKIKTVRVPMNPAARLAAWERIRGMITPTRMRQIIKELKTARKGWNRTR